MPFHVVRFRLQQLEDYDKKVEENQKLQEQKKKSKSRK
jgi:hypothetical protein